MSTNTELPGAVSTQTTAAGVTEAADRKRWWALVAVSLATFMTYLDK